MTAGNPRLFAVQQEQLTSDDYYTPAWVFERMGITFDLDVCAPPGGIDWIPAARYYTQADDGLLQPWQGRVWMNPPYSTPTPWVERFIGHAWGVALLPHSASPWHRSLWERATAWVAVDRFQFTATHRNGWSFMPVFFAAFGDDCCDAISRLGVVRRIA
jgi:hypothetical protein